VGDGLGHIRPRCSAGRAHVGSGDLGHSHSRCGRASVACRVGCAAQAAR
jgi:hypothetical protein